MNKKGREKEDKKVWILMKKHNQNANPLYILHERSVIYSYDTQSLEQFFENILKRLMNIKKMNIYTKQCIKKIIRSNKNTHKFQTEMTKPINGYPVIHTNREKANEPSNATAPIVNNPVSIAR